MGFDKTLLALAIPAIASALPQVSKRIVNGEVADDGEFPFIVSLQWEGYHGCGGSLLDSRTVLTAAHCGQDTNASDWKVRAGSNDRHNGGTFVGVTDIIEHPNWNSTTYDFDLRIVKLDTDIPESDTIKYATLPTADYDPEVGSRATTIGWGAIEGGENFNELRKLTVPIVSREECQETHDWTTITENMFCAGGEKEKGVCHGDSGSPFIDASGNVVGLSSFVNSLCGIEGEPAAFARIGKMLSFVEEHLESAEKGEDCEEKKQKA